MTPDPLQAKAIFLAALEHSGEKRDAFLDEACAGAPELRARVEQLLAAHERPDSRIAAPSSSPGTVDSQPDAPQTAAAPVAIAETPGMVIGPYKLLEQIGEGGMGTVWMAEQHQPIRRRVALKVIKPGMDSKQVLGRFDAERQALALMDHPNIARVLDAGATAAGRPYFVMELVKGVPITKYCDEKRLPPRERLELFVSVCQAVQHAHQKGIIHRDLKPSNVLVAPYDGRPVVKVIDFGVAKATGQQLTDRTLFTGFGAVVGTLEYMSPEQAELNNNDIDTRSDIYSLGVLLYELLTGSTPLTRKQCKEAALLEVLRLVREQESAKPSTRLSSTDELPTIAANRGLEPKKLSRLVRGELDWIVMKALDKDRSRRYETANGFAMDLQRYLCDEQVLACPPSVGYRLRKFARRNKVAFTTAAVVLAALVLGILGTTWQAIRATNAEHQAVAEQKTAQDERDLADEARKDAEEARDEEKKLRVLEKKQREEAERQRKRAEDNFAKARQAVDDYFTAVSESQLLMVSGMQVLRRQLLLSALGFYEQFLKERGDDPSIRAGVASAQLRVGKILRELGDGARANRALQAARAAYDSASKDSPKDLELKAGLAECWYLVGNYDESITLREELLLAERTNARFKRDLADSLNMRGLTFVRAKKSPEEALAAYRRCVELRMELARDYPRDPYVQASVFNSFNNIGAELSNRGHRQQAYEMYVQANQYGQAACALMPHSVDFSTGLAVGLSNVGESLWTLGRKEESLREFHKVADRLKMLSQNNPAVPSVLNAYVRALQKLSTKQRALGQTGEAAQSLRLIRGFVERMPRQTPDEIYDLACYRAICAALIGDGQEKLSADEEVERRELADRAMEALQQAVAQGFANVELMKKDDDLTALRPRDDFQKLVTRLDNEAKVETLAKGVKGTTDQQMRAKAELAALLQKLTADDPRNLRHRATLATSRQAIGLWEMELGKLDEAAKSLEQAATLREELVKEDPENQDYRAELAVCLVNLGKLDWKTGRHAAAVRRWEKGLALFDLTARGESPTAEFLAKAAQAEHEVAIAFGELGLFTDAARLYGQVIEHRPPTMPHLWRVHACYRLLIGDQEGYRKACAEIIARFGSSKEPLYMHIMAATCTMGPVGFGDLPRWISLAEEFVTDPKQSWATVYIGLANHRAGRFPEAGKLLLEKSQTTWIWPVLAMNYHRLGQPAEARSWLKRSDEWYAQTVRAHLLGESKLALGGLDPLGRLQFLVLHREAKTLIEGAALPAPWLHLWQGRIYTLLGKNFKAQANFQAAIATRPNDPEVWLARAQVYAKLGEHAKAQEDFAKAIALKLDDVGPLIARGRYFAERGEHAKSDADFTKAATLTPEELNRFIEGGWWVAGPYPYDLKLSSPPEVQADPSKTVAAFPGFPVVSMGSPGSWPSLIAGFIGPQLDWKPCAPDQWGTVFRGHPSLEKPGGPVSVYGLTYVYSPDERPATLLVGGDLTRVWLNGRPVHEMKQINNSYLGLDRVLVTLKPGRNTLLVKTNDKDGGLLFRVRLADHPLDRGYDLADLGMWKEAAIALGRWFERASPGDAMGYSYALTSVLAGDVESYRRHCAGMREYAQADFRSYLLRPEGAPDTAWLLQLAKKTLTAPKDGWHALGLSMAYFRAGQFESALQFLGAEHDNWYVAWPAKAMIYHRLGKGDKARALLEKIDQGTQSTLRQALARTPFRITSQVHWADWAYFEVFRREAKQLIEGKPPADDPALLAALRACACSELKEYAKAQTEFDQALKLRPDDLDIQKAHQNFLAARR